MSTDAQRATVAMMARAPIEGQCKTRLGATIGAAAATKLYAAMIEDSVRGWSRVDGVRRVLLAAPEHDGVRALERLAPAGWEVVPQRGTGLGERLANGVRALGSDGGAVVLVDSDSPTLPVESIAERVLGFGGEGRALFGPCDDGGYYLVGLTVSELGILEDIPWSTSRVLEVSIERCCASSISAELLPAWYDVDDEADLRRLICELRESPDRAPACRDALFALGLLKEAAR